MSSAILNYKKNELSGKSREYQDVRKIQCHNPIYQHPVKLGCKYCKRDHKKGRVRSYTSLWQLYHHIRREHPHEPNQKEFVESLADLIIQGVLL